MIRRLLSPLAWLLLRLDEKLTLRQRRADSWTREQAKLLRIHMENSGPRSALD